MDKMLIAGPDDPLGSNQDEMVIKRGESNYFRRVFNFKQSESSKQSIHETIVYKVLK